MESKGSKKSKELKELKELIKTNSVKDREYINKFVAFVKGLSNEVLKEIFKKFFMDYYFKRQDGLILLEIIMLKKALIERKLPVEYSASYQNDKMRKLYENIEQAMMEEIDKILETIELKKECDKRVDGLLLCIDKLEDISKSN